MGLLTCLSWQRVEYFHLILFNYVMHLAEKYINNKLIVETREEDAFQMRQTDVVHKGIYVYVVAKISFFSPLSILGSPIKESMPIVGVKPVSQSGLSGEKTNISKPRFIIA